MIIGREAELGKIEHALNETRHFRGSALFLVGEEGIGKSRLASEATARGHAGGVCVLRGRGSDIGPPIPFRPLVEALLYLLRTGRPPSDEELGPYNGVLGALAPDFWREQLSERQSSLVVLAEAIMRFTAAAGRGRGCVVILEDLQNADAEMLAVVEYLADNLDRQPTVLLGTMRGVPCEALDLAHAAAFRGSCCLIELARLDKHQLRKLAGACFGVLPAAVPSRVTDWLWRDSAGNPAVAEELLRSMASAGRLVLQADRLQLIGGVRPRVPRAFARTVSRQADRLGPEGKKLLISAAVLGRRFPLPVAQVITGLSDEDLACHISAAVAAGLVTVDESDADWCFFALPLTAAALLQQLTTVGRASVANAAADAAEVLWSGMPDEWCQLGVMLRLAAHDRVGACRLLSRAGRRALADGMPGKAAALLDRGWRLSAKADAELRADMLDLLVTAIAETGQIDQALALAPWIEELSGLGASTSRIVTLRASLGWAACVAGRWAEATGQVAAARRALDHDSAPPLALQIDAVAACVAARTPRPGGDKVARELAERALAGAQRGGAPAAGCQALLALGELARKHDVARSTDCFERLRVLASQHGLPIWRLRAKVQIGIDRWLVTGDARKLRRAGRVALRTGAVALGFDVEVGIALHHVLRGHFAAGGEVLDRCLSRGGQLKLIDKARQIMMIKAILAAHQGDRGEMDRALAEFRQFGGERSDFAPLAAGLANTFCALLEEDAVLARTEVARAVAKDARTPGGYPLAGGQGLQLLLGVLRGDASWLHYDQVASSPASELRWNRQFLLAARAVLLGRDGRKDEAMEVMSRAEQAAAPFTMAHHIVLRLAAEAAHADGWGAPAAWLRSAEEYFRGGSTPAIEGACRALLRRIGVPVPRRRSAVSSVPKELRKLAVTPREYEVLQLLATRPSNKTIAGKLYISPRTVEKHVASLILKIGQPNRAGLCEFASTAAGDQAAARPEPAVQRASVQ